MLPINQKEREMKFISPEICTDNDCHICSTGMCTGNDYDCTTEINRAKHDVILLSKMHCVDFYGQFSGFCWDDFQIDKRLEEYGTMLLQYVKKYDKFQLHCTELIFRQSKLSSLVNINMIHEYYGLGKNPNKERINHDKFFEIYFFNANLKKYKIEFGLAKKYFIKHCEMNGNNDFSHCDEATEKAVKLNRYSLYFLQYLSQYRESAKNIDTEKSEFLKKKLSKFINIDFIIQYYKLDKHGRMSHIKQWVIDYFVSLGLRYTENEEEFKETMSQMGLQLLNGYGCFFLCKNMPINTGIQSPDQKKYMDHIKLLDINKIARKKHAPYIDIFNHINQICHRKSDLLHNIVAFKKIAQKLNLINDVVELVFIELKKIYIESYGVSLFITHEYFTEKILGIKPEESCNCYMKKKEITFVDVRNILAVDKDITELDYDWLRINCQSCRNKNNTNI